MLERLDPVLEKLQRPFNPILDLIPNRLRPFLDFRGRSQRTDFITILCASLFLNVAAYFVRPPMEHRIVTPQDIIILSGPQTPIEWALTAANWFLSIWFMVFLCRRLHDQDLPAILLLIHVAIFWLLGLFHFEGWLAIFYVVSFWIIVFVAILRRGTIGPNRFSPDPRGWESVEHFEREQVRLKSGNV